MHGPVLAGNAWQSASAARPVKAARTNVHEGRSDVSVILTHNGSLVEWVKYTPYGEPISLPAGDVNGDFAFDDDDEAIISDYIENGGTYDVRYDTMLTGRVGTDDIAHAHSIAGGYQTLGRGVLSSEGVQNRFGYAGYRYDHHLSGGAGAGRHLYHVRHRVYQAHIGRWMTRDPLGYVDGMGLYGYVASDPVYFTDPWGAASECPSVPSFTPRICPDGDCDELWTDPPPVDGVSISGSTRRVGQGGGGCWMWYGGIG
jgi:RHS repeat-associated protein